jgi:2-dehydropantoate 2-reductase
VRGGKQVRIAIVGTGAMGSVYAGLLGDAGHDVWAIDVHKSHIDAIRKDGLRLEGASGDRVVRINATCDPSEVGVCDMIIIATKAMQVASAVGSLDVLAGPNSVIVTIQNGIGAAEQIRRILPPSRLLIGVAEGFGASLKAPGHVFHHGMELIRLGEMTGGLSERLEQTVRVWRGAGFNVKGYADIDQLIWEKFICNVTFSGTCTVLSRTVDEVMEDEHSWKIALGCGLEAYEIGLAKKIHFSFRDAEAYIATFGEKLSGSRPSMLLDHMARQRSEIDYINGMVPVLAHEVGMRAPINEVIASLVKAIESEFE